jgi:predicted enzyme involved in methoxymalonyl-ACP biosynthesis
MTLLTQLTATTIVWKSQPWFSFTSQMKSDISALKQNSVHSKCRRLTHFIEEYIHALNIELDSSSLDETKSVLSLHH